MEGIEREIKSLTTRVRCAKVRGQTSCVTRSMSKLNPEVREQLPMPTFEKAKGCERIRLSERLVRRVKGWKAFNVTTA